MERSDPLPHLAHHFDTLEQQHETNLLGMWLFLVTEIMLFGGLFTAYTAYRIAYHATFAQGSELLNPLLGGINTAVLLISSLMMVLAVHAAQTGHRRRIVVFLLLTALFGTIFMGVKAIEYYTHFQEHLYPGVNFVWNGPNPGPMQLFFVLYFLMTGLHALHLTIGIVIVLITAVLAARGRFGPQSFLGIEMVGLYWHLIDVIWVFLFPLLYLISR